MVRRNKPYIEKDDLVSMDVDTEHARNRYPRINELYVRLSPAGGKYFYIDPADSDYWIDRLLEYGEFIDPIRVSYDISRKCKLKPMYCYENLLATFPPKYTQRRVDVYIGYSLMIKEDLWLQHTWYYDGRTIYESTPLKSSKYFGMKISPIELANWLEIYRWRLPRDPNWVD